MAKLTKAQRKLHDQAVELLKKDILTEDEKEFVFENWHEGANHINGEAGAFFTPLDLAWDVALEAVGYSPDLRVLDICAGIGVLSYCMVKRNPHIKLVCVDVNRDYVEIGKKLVPEAEWHHIDICDLEEMLELGHFDVAVSNPPYGKVRTLQNLKLPKYSGAESEFKIMEVAAMMADSSVFLIPQNSATFKYSGVRQYEDYSSNKANSFIEQTEITMDIGLAIDTTAYSCFKDVKITTEIVTLDNSAYQVAMNTKEQVQSPQFDLFAAA